MTTSFRAEKLALLLLVGCAGDLAPRPRPAAARAPAASPGPAASLGPAASPGSAESREPARARAGTGRREIVFEGACDASGAVPLTRRSMIVADDEDNVLRTYDAEAGGPPLAATDVSTELHLPLTGKKRLRARELDLEAATRVRNRAYWLASHARSKKGRLAPERLRLFATTLGEGGAIHVVGQAYDRLVEDLVAAPALAHLGLAAAAGIAPNQEGGLNIEGLTTGPDGRVLIAFRNPTPRGRAIVISILNLDELTAGSGPVRFGDPILLDLGGHGVRALSWWRGRYLIVGGHYAAGRRSILFTWDGTGRPAPVSSVDLGDYNPEAFFTPEDRDQILLISDDGERAIDGMPCKKLKDPARRRFRGVWLTLPT